MCLLHKRHLSQTPHEWQSVDCDTGLLPSVNWWHRLRGNIFNKLQNNFHKVLFIIVRIICWKRIIIPQGRRVANIWDALYLRCGARGNALCSDWYACPQIPHSYIQSQMPLRLICTNINIVYWLNLVRMANAVNVNLWLSVTYPQCHDSSFAICQE